MDSYLHSGAVNRHHYALAHKVENSSVQDAEAAIWAEIDRIRTHIARGLTDAREELVILMYCYTAASVRTVSVSDLEFALSPAVNLAATGRAVKDRRIGLTFCAMFMGVDHPLQVMLVNTLRKEIESDEPARITLATDFIIASPSQFLAPAVAPRLEILLSHKSQNLRRRALFALRALDAVSQAHAHSSTDSLHPSDTYLSHHKSTIMRRLTRAAREDYVRSDEVGAVGGLLVATRDLLQDGELSPKEVVPPMAALLEKTILACGKSKRQSQSSHRKPDVRLVTPLIATLCSAASVRGRDQAADNVLVDLAKLAVRVIFVFAQRPASPQVLQAFRLLGALPVRVVHTLLLSTVPPTPTPPSTSAPSTSSTPPAEKPQMTIRHPVPVLRPLLLSRDPTERWAGLAALEALDASLWASVPVQYNEDLGVGSRTGGEGSENGKDERGGGDEKVIPPVLDEWEVGAIMRGLGDPDGTLRKLTMRVLYKVDPQLLHAFLEQLLNSPSATKENGHGDPLEVIHFLYGKDGSAYARGVGRALEQRIGGGAQGVDEKLVEAVVVVVHESDQTFKSAFADAMLERLDGSLISPLSGGTAGAGQVDPTSVLLFATTASDVTRQVGRAVDVLVGLLSGRGAGIQEVLLLAALRLVPRLEKDGGGGEVKGVKARVEAFGKGNGVGKYIRGRCELFVRFVDEMDVLRRIVEETRASSLPDFLQALLAYKPSAPTPVAKLATTSPAQSPRLRPTTSPAFSTVSLSGPSGLRYDAYAPPPPVPRRTRPVLKSPYDRGSGDLPRSDSGGSPFVNPSMEDVSGKGKGRMKSGDELRLEVGEENPNPNADLITLSAVESPFREETDFGSLSLSASASLTEVADPTHADARSDSHTMHASGSTTGSERAFHTAVMTSPTELAPADADAIWASFDKDETEAGVGRQTLRGWCDRNPEAVGAGLRGMDIGFATQKVGTDSGAHEREVFAYIPGSARAVVRLKPAEDGSCLWMLRCAEWELRVKIRKLLDGEST